MTMKAVGTAAMEMVQEVEIQFDEVGEHSRCSIIVSRQTCTTLLTDARRGRGEVVPIASDEALCFFRLTRISRSQRPGVSIRVIPFRSILGENGTQSVV